MRARARARRSGRRSTTTLRQRRCDNDDDDDDDAATGVHAAHLLTLPADALARARARADTRASSEKALLFPCASRNKALIRTRQSARANCGCVPRRSKRHFDVLAALRRQSGCERLHVTPRLRAFMCKRKNDGGGDFCESRARARALLSTTRCGRPLAFFVLLLLLLALSSARLFVRFYAIGDRRRRCASAAARARAHK